MREKKPMVGPEVVFSDRSDKFGGDVTIYHRACSTCRHYLGNWKCAAYPKRIPEEILLGKHDHTTPFPGDSGIMYEQEG